MICNAQCIITTSSHLSNQLQQRIIVCCNSDKLLICFCAASLVQLHDVDVVCKDEYRHSGIISLISQTLDYNQSRASVRHVKKQFINSSA